MKRFLCGGVAAIAFAAGCRSPVRPVDAKDPLAGFDPTGQLRKCVQSYDINETRVLDESSILFRVHVDEYYVNRLTRPCPGLSVERRFKYTLRGGSELCSGDGITVLDSSGTGAGCILGQFEKLDKKK
jgi:hypothetical protein